MVDIGFFNCLWLWRWSRWFCSLSKLPVLFLLCIAMVPMELLEVSGGVGLRVLPPSKPSLMGRRPLVWKNYGHRLFLSRNFIFYFYRNKGYYSEIWMPIAKIQKYLTILSSNFSLFFICQSNLTWTLTIIYLIPVSINRLSINCL